MFSVCSPEAKGITKRRPANRRCGANHRAMRDGFEAAGAAFGFPHPVASAWEIRSAAVQRAPSDHVDALGRLLADEGDAQTRDGRSRNQNGRADRYYAQRELAPVLGPAVSEHRGARRERCVRSTARHGDMVLSGESDRQFGSIEAGNWSLCAVRRCRLGYSAPDSASRAFYLENVGSKMPQPK
jgi:hypothetical protein